MATINKNLSFNKRKPDLLLDGGEVVEKRKKGRPRKDKMATPLSQPLTQVGEEVHTFLNLFINSYVLKQKYFCFAFLRMTLEYDCKAPDKDESVSMPVSLDR